MLRLHYPRGGRDVQQRSEHSKDGQRLQKNRGYCGIATATEQQSAATEQTAKTAAEVRAMAEETNRVMTRSDDSVHQLKDAFKQLHDIIVSMN